MTRSLTDVRVDAATLTPEELDRFSIEVSQAGLTDALLLDGLLLCLYRVRLIFQSLSAYSVLYLCPFAKKFYANGHKVKSVCGDAADAFANQGQSGTTAVLICSRSRCRTYCTGRRFAYAVSDGEDDGQIAAVENVIQDSALRAAQDEQKDKDPQAAVAAEVSETTVH